MFIIILIIFNFNKYLILKWTKWYKVNKNKNVYRSKVIQQLLFNRYGNSKFFVVFYYSLISEYYDIINSSPPYS